MEWHYAEDGRQIGPIAGSQFQRLVESGKITPETLVWHEEMDDWQPYSQAVAIAAVPGSPPEGGPEESACCECGKLFSHNEMMNHGEAWVCAVCKPVFIQRLQEGGNLPGVIQYGGFWIRFGAKMIDGLVMYPINMLVTFVGVAITGMMATQGIIMLLTIGTQATYATWMVGKYGATLGKMACGLRVVMPDGGRVSYGRALGRYFAEVLSGMTFGIGYIIAAFDDERRTLHDRICNTRVIVVRK